MVQTPLRRQRLCQALGEEIMHEIPIACAAANIEGAVSRVIGKIVWNK